jgi:hypothetical protein
MTPTKTKQLQRRIGRLEERIVRSREEQNGREEYRRSAENQIREFRRASGEPDEPVILDPNLTKIQIGSLVLNYYLDMLRKQCRPSLPSSDPRPGP